MKQLVHYHSPKAQTVPVLTSTVELNWLEQDRFGWRGELASSPLLETVSVSDSQNTYTFSSNGADFPELWLIEGDSQIYLAYEAAITSPHYRQTDSSAFDMASNHQAFDQKWGFDGWLGYCYKPEKSLFRLWAPTAEKVSLVLYDKADADKVSQLIPMTRGQEINTSEHKYNTQGVWFAKLEGDYKETVFCYRIEQADGRLVETRDPYSTAVTADGKRSVLLDAKAIEPENFRVCHGDDAPWRLSNLSQATVYEMHIRDFSISESSGVPENLRGSYLGACQTGTRNAEGLATTLDYLQESPISYVQLQPIFDHHQSFDQEGNLLYNWGYDPENYNVPDGSFSSNPSDPKARILELKTLIQAYHDAGIGVIMDVVYNHTYSKTDSAFQLSVPYYYYRVKADGIFYNGSICGNETASEKEMMRKYMIDSILYWAETYNIDGFRFDLMGLHDIETMKAIRQALDTIDPNIIIYGEGWDMACGLKQEDKAIKAHADRLERIGFFNDDARDSIKGAEIFGELKKGFVSGQPVEKDLMKALAGSAAFVAYQKTSQVVNYVEAHDNYTLNDLLLALHPQDNQETHDRRCQLASALNIISQGLCFMQLGQSFNRSKLVATGDKGQLTVSDKERAMNSYNAPDKVNQIDWNLASPYQESDDFLKQLIQLKREHKQFSLEDYQDISKAITVNQAQNGSGLVSYDIDLGTKNYRVLITNRQKDLLPLVQDLSNWRILLSNNLATDLSKNILSAYSLTILATDN
ncbi:type I pullulanase [Streptococcus saliviloxodontae]|uniref:Pullulanase n=1 Tax=Streptococcus saliviloxodontae TaxID=1349416 RepID=A0ABS2PIL0_9STRE|nr:type I pullulanase [Streptococcus saliviloxodontae]MBM7635259.1 pullulanase [Streptococcus saliviloxodontae]